MNNSAISHGLDNPAPELIEEDLLGQLRTQIEGLTTIIVALRQQLQTLVPGDQPIEQVSLAQFRALYQNLANQQTLSTAASIERTNLLTTAQFNRLGQD